MAIIYTYPTKLPAVGDWILISDVSETNPKNATRKCTVSDILAMGTGEDYDLNAGTKVGSYVPLNLTSTSGTDDSVVQFTEGTNITLTRNSATQITIDAAGGGTMSSWILTGDSGTQTITDGNTVDIEGGTAITTAATATDKVTVTLDNTAVTPGAYTYTSLTVDQQGRITTASSGAAPGTMSAFDVDGSSGAAQTITNGNTLNILGTSPITTVASATDTITVSSAAYAGTTNIGYVPTGGSASTFLRGDATWVTPTDTTYSKATASALGLVKLEDVAVQTTAANAITTTALKTYGVQFNASDQLVVNVPWTGGGTVTGFTPMDMYEATGETGVGGKRIFVQTVSPTTFTATKVKIFVHAIAASPVFTIGIYAGTLKAGGGALLGQGNVSAVATGINVITLVPTNPGDLDLVAGTDYVIAYDQSATNSSCVGSSTALSNVELATTLATSGAFVDPLVIGEGMVATGLRVAMTIW